MRSASAPWRCREYLDEVRRAEIGQVAICDATGETKGPEGRYGAVLYIEKEGFLPILEAAQIAERFDLALASSKGMSVTACRTLVEELCGRRGLPAVHPARFRRSGFSIKQTLMTSNRRYTFEHEINHIDLGLRLADVSRTRRAWKPSRCARADKATIAGACASTARPQDEIDFLLPGPERSATGSNSTP